MRLQDEEKRRLILEHAARMFATEQYHKVRLDDVAAAAGIGKGTVYVYFQSKEDLYFSIIYEGFGLLVERLNGSNQGQRKHADERLRQIVDELVDFAFQHPQWFELMRTVGPPKEQEQWAKRRGDMFALIEQTIRDGIAEGHLNDSDPELTALLIPGLVRSAMLFGPKEMDATRLKRRLQELIAHGLGCRAKGC